MSKTIDRRDPQQRAFATAREMVDRELENIIKYINDQVKKGWDDKEYLEWVVVISAPAFSAWVACRVMGDTVGQKLIEARVQEGFPEWEDELASYESSYQFWASNLRFRTGISH